MKQISLFLSILFIITFVAHPQLISDKKIKLYAIYTPDYQPLVDNWFLKTLNQFNEYEIILEKHTTISQQKDFLRPGWVEAIEKKVNLIIKAIQENWGNYFVFSDVDIQFFAPFAAIIEEVLNDYDIVFQKESMRGDVCTGFFACRANEKTLSLWQEAKKLMKQTKNDQKSINSLIQSKNPFRIRWGYLPENFFGGGTFTQGTGADIWKPGKHIIHVPENPIMHHANYCISLNHKIKQLQHVHDIVLNRQ